jgi:tagatose 1,6-diphosphate aldolase
MSKLSVGKIRGLQQIATTDGFFLICAMDHRGSFQKMIEAEQMQKVGYQDIVEYKLDLCDSLAPYSSGILLDPNFGAAQCIAAGTLPGQTGLLVSIEATGYESRPDGRVTKLQHGWSVEKIKRMGAAAVKILIYYRPDMKDVAEKQLETVKYVARQCQKNDIPLLVEPVTYAIKGEDIESREYSIKKSEIVIQTARQITELSIDVLKSEFPANLQYEMNRSKLLEICQRLDQASAVPWVILSAGVDYEQFRQQVEIACQAGASGFLGGRAIWQDALKIRERKERNKFLKTTVARRLKELGEIATKYGKPWFRKINLEAHELTLVSENWYKTY